LSGFTDALTELLETVVRQRADLDPFEKRWERSVAAVQSERAVPKDQAEPEQDWIQSLTEDELR
jgi:hypothetical protein